MRVVMLTVGLAVLVAGGCLMQHEPKAGPGDNAPPQEEPAPVVEDGVESGREIAARFLDVAPDEIEFARQTVSAVLDEAATSEHYQWTDPESERTVHIGILPEESRVYKVIWEGALTAGEPQVTEEEALATALEWARRFPGLDPDQEPVYDLRPYGDDRSAHRFRWRGEGPEQGTHIVTVEIDAVTGRPRWYSALWWPPAPEPTTEFRITSEQAGEIARAEALRQYHDLEIDELSVSDINTASAWAPAGEPVYVVSVEGRIVEPGQLDLNFADQYGVHATTGDVLRPMWQRD